MKGRKVFLDTGILIAALNRRDRYHAQARSLFGGPLPRWHSSVLVWSEAYSWLLHRHGEEQARACRRLVENLDGLVLLEGTSRLHRDTCRILDRLRGARLTYVDASSLALMEQHEIGIAWATDHHLGLTGAEVFPRS
ncbi:PIN domain-containing protein [Candidatus Palauibacter polyketidifaciens]|uniref:type II toxin-antitoxin system VapC family toxin n=1 Tax=Candidatus Palauibacter polyketidifaciens TaxID=3056740 RepID=UPI00139C6ECB|nr:PIN domain-containing protein [Candidatus Palauibacter polyketidifaciens]MDE2719735.1 PIN domain-containing protein [Candidatus Palauibacter polyketidifaciens]MYE35223.1 PIN domain-containing protein [Gemmatimonadales bacterium]